MESYWLDSFQDSNETYPIPEKSRMSNRRSLREKREKVLSGFTVRNLIEMPGSDLALNGPGHRHDLSTDYTEALREIVKVRCKYCGALNLETSQDCANC